MRSRIAWSLLLLILPVFTGCTSASSNASTPGVAAGLPVAEVFTPGVVPGVEPETCRRHGGVPVNAKPRSESHGDADNTYRICRLGQVVAIYRCDNNLMMARLKQTGGTEILQGPERQYELVEIEIGEDETRWSGEHRTLVETSSGASVSSAQGTVACGVTRAES